MTSFQVRYWFESSAREKSGEHIMEIIEADGPQAVIRRIQDFLAKDTFMITPSFGPATGGFVVIHAKHVRYVEIIPSQTAGASPTGYATTTMELP